MQTRDYKGVDFGDRWCYVRRALDWGYWFFTVVYLCETHLCVYGRKGVLVVFVLGCD